MPRPPPTPQVRWAKSEDEGKRVRLGPAQSVVGGLIQPGRPLERQVTWLSLSFPVCEMGEYVSCLPSVGVFNMTCGAAGTHPALNRSVLILQVSGEAAQTPLGALEKRKAPSPTAPPSPSSF